ncbi:DUF5802 family protein [Halobaculum sp. MBLA0143]|uniref:DUF5802 family protein n=1 Tax=Halobaculum sp. MBLA0143 TaxID=3079933 RepID=UPI003526B65D
MFEQFSAGYYLGELYVQPRETDRAAIKRADHERVNEQLFGDESGLTRLDTPLVMKLGTRHFPVIGDEDLPSGTLTVPTESVPEDMKFEVPGRTEVFLADADRTGELLEYAGWSGEPPV